MLHIYRTVASSVLKACCVVSKGNYIAIRTKEIGEGLMAETADKPPRVGDGKVHRPKASPSPLAMHKGRYLTSTQTARIERVQQAFTDARKGRGLFGLKD
jgi:hypothetical protein